MVQWAQKIGPHTARLPDGTVFFLFDPRCACSTCPATPNVI
jgi:hypothetical protein